jgi:hypothetical protein
MVTTTQARAKEMMKKENQPSKILKIVPNIPSLTR